MDRVRLGEVVALPHSSAPGPDGLPYCAWNGHAIFVDALFAMYEHLLDGGEVPDGFNDSLMAMLAKGGEELDRVGVARAPDKLRPINLSNAAVKLVVHAGNADIVPSVVEVVHSSQSEGHPWEVHDR